ncbi:oligosaccharide flippase family protein [Mycobacterium hodleri]|uniref:oligosaccharide flippase family protein n=1 Tax=Mycolicibacterium hodleri TaxID=49897 RepID=UPI0021F3682F|nr:oligosaccharide flippase family protein [Mycolicibacterium hodleri]MCV7135840.1 oligosaccharide flippase family protein [Mycolicibacterium hodleri]
MTASLSGILKRGVGYSAVGVVVCQLAVIVQTIALGRILGPGEVGVYAAGSVLSGFLLAFTQSTLAQALIQRDDDIEDAANTVLIVTFAAGVLLGIGVLIASPVVGYLFHDARAGQISAATSGLVVLYMCVSVPEVLMQRDLRFKQRMVIQPAAKIAFAGVSIAFASMGFGAWALVVGSYASITVLLGLSWWMARWRPFRGRFSVALWREMAVFSFPLLLDNVSHSIREAFQQVLLGRRLGTADLGQYRYGSQMAAMPAMAIVEVFGYVLFPAFTRVSADPARFRDAFLRALGWTWFGALPVGVLLLVLGRPVVVLLLGDAWHPAGTAAMAMSGIAVGAALQALGITAIKGAGRSSLVNWLSALGLALHIPLILLLLPFGLVGVGIGLSVTYLACGVVAILLARSVVEASLRDVVDVVAPSTLAAAVALAVVFPLEHVVTRSDRFVEPVGLAAVAVECVLLAGIYVGVLRLVSPSRYRSVRGLVGNLASRLGGAVPR